MRTPLHVINRVLKIVGGVIVIIGLIGQTSGPAHAAGQITLFLPLVVNNYPEPGSIGSISYTLDGAKSVSGLFPADNQNGLTLTTTDALGYTWELTIPKDGLLVPTQITLTPFASVNSGDAQVAVKTGVVMQPNGLVFTDPATMSLVLPSGSTERGLMLDSDQAGTNLAFADATAMSSGYTATIFHFSTTDYSSDGSDLNPYLAPAEAAYASALAQVNSMAKVVEQPGVPPDYTYNCQNLGLDAARQAADNYIKTVFARDNAAIENLLGATRALDLITGNINDSEALNAILNLLDTDGFRKITSIQNGYGSNPQKFLAVSATILSFLHRYILLGGDESTEASWFQTLVSDGQKARQYYMDQLVKNHDYTMRPVLLDIDRTLQMMGMPDDSATFFAALQKAFTFNLIIDDQSGTNSVETTTQHGQIKTQPDISLLTWTGSGTMGYVSGQIFTPGGAGVLQTPLTYTVNFSFNNLNLCQNPSADLTIHPLGAETETYLIAGQTVPFTGFAQADAMAALKQYFDQNTATWTFHLTIINKQALAVDQTINGTGLANTYTNLHIQMQHTP